MAIDIEEYQSLKAELEKQKTAADQAAGAYQQILQRLKDEFGCKNLAAAERMLKDLDAQLEEAEKEYNDALDEYRREWGSQLTDDAP